MIHLAIVSDIRLYREALVELLNNNNHIHVSGTADSAESAIQLIRQVTPDVVLLDMTMLESSQLVGQIFPYSPDTQIVALAMPEEEDRILTCVQAGITGYLSREVSLEQLIDTVQGVAKGELRCPRRIVASLFHKLKTLPASNSAEPSVNRGDDESVEAKMSSLTGRERQITQLIAEGLSNKQIARQLVIEISTVKNHVHNILTKMNLHSRVHLISAMQQQLSYE